MGLNRRSFIGLGSLAACGTLLSTSAIFAAPAARLLRGGLPLTPGDTEVLSFVQGYSAEVRIVGASVLARIRTGTLKALHIIAKIGSPEEVVAALATVSFSGVYSEGNSLCFKLGETDVTVENLLPEVFAARLAAMAKPAGNAFAHDALSYDPATKLLSDPFSARLTGVRVINRTFGNEAALDVALRGTEELNGVRLPATAEFSGWKARILRQIARTGTAEKMARTFLQRLALLTEQVTPAVFKSLLRSKLVSTALLEVFEADTAAVVASFEKARLELGAAYGDAAIWLALLIGPEIQSESTDGAATSWLFRGSRAQVSRSRKALAQAREILENYPTFPN